MSNLYSKSADSYSDLVNKNWIKIDWKPNSTHTFLKPIEFTTNILGKNLCSFGDSHIALKETMVVTDIFIVIFEK